MALTCPACNKPNQTQLTCQRCGCDLTQLHAIRQHAAACLKLAAQSLRARDWSESIAQAGQSWELFHSRDAAECAFIAAGALGDTNLALFWHARASRADATRALDLEPLPSAPRIESSLTSYSG